MPFGRGGHRKRAHAAPRGQQRASDSRKLHRLLRGLPHLYTSTRTRWVHDPTSSRSRLGPFVWGVAALTGPRRRPILRLYWPRPRLDASRASPRPRGDPHTALMAGARLHFDSASEWSSNWPSTRPHTGPLLNGAQLRLGSSLFDLAENSTGPRRDSGLAFSN